MCDFHAYSITFNSQFIWVLGICVAVHRESSGVCGITEITSSAARMFKAQTRLFLGVFLLLTVQRLVYKFEVVRLDALHEDVAFVGDDDLQDTYNKTSDYLHFIGQCSDRKINRQTKRKEKESMGHDWGLGVPPLVELLHLILCVVY